MIVSHIDSFTHIYTFTLTFWHFLSNTSILSLTTNTFIFSFNFLAEEAAARAVKELNGLEVMGREMRADFAVKKDNSQNNTRQRDSNQAGEW